jgi:hypothetical protein
MWTGCTTTLQHQRDVLREDTVCQEAVQAVPGGCYSCGGSTHCFASSIYFDNIGSPASWLIFDGRGYGVYRITGGTGGPLPWLRLGSYTQGTRALHRENCPTSRMLSK